MTSLADERTQRQRLRDAIAAQAIEANPLPPDEIRMFEMFEHEGWSIEQRRAYILAHANVLAAE